MESTQKNPVEMTASELEALLAEKKKTERQAKEKRQREYIKGRDLFISSIVTEMIELSAQMAELKKRALTIGNEKHDLLYEVFEKEPKELKKFTIVNEADDQKLEIQSADRQMLDESAEVAIAEIKEILREKFAARNKTVYNMLDAVMMKNNKGDYDERLVAKLRKWESDVNDQRFSDALDLLSQAYYITGTSMYVRAYVKNKRNGWELINMQFSSI